MGRTDVWTFGQKFPPLFYRTSSPSGPLPKKAIKDLKLVINAKGGLTYPMTYPCHMCQKKHILKGIVMITNF